MRTATTLALIAAGVLFAALVFVAGYARDTETRQRPPTRLKYPVPVTTTVAPYGPRSPRE